MVQQMAKVVNGFNVGDMVSLVEKLQARPELGVFRFQAHNHWMSGGHCQTRIKDFYGLGQEQTSREAPFTHDADEPPVLLGEDHGANPVEYVLTALSSCLTTSLVAQAAARGIPLEHVESELEGDLDVRGFFGIDPTVRNGYQNIRVRFHVTAPEATDEQRQELCQLAQERSPVFDIVTNAVPVNVELAQD